MGSTVILPSKTTTESPVIQVDTTSQMDAGEVVGSALVQVSVFSGVDPNPSAILLGVASVFQNVVTQQVTGGLPGVIYLLRITLNTNQSNVKIVLGNLAVTNPDTT